MSNHQSIFFNEFTFKNGVKVKNRLALAPMTNSQSNEDGSLGEDEYNWLLSRSNGGFGIVSTCASYIMPSAKAWQGQLGIYDDHQILALHQLTDDLRAQNSISIMQIFHGGVRCPSRLTGQQPVSASEFKLDFPDFETPRALTKAEIINIINAFADAAERAYKAGFDGIEIHGANGYLITQFISTQTNLRDDEFGGSVENRARFARLIVQACRQRVPNTFLVGIRISPEGLGLDVDDNLQIGEWLMKDGVDYINLSLGNILAPAQKYAKTSNKTVTSYFRDRLGQDFPLIAGGSVQTATQAEQAIEQGATFVSLGRIAIGNAQWPLSIVNSDFTPVSPPYSIAYLQQHGISDKFLGYLHTMPKGFVLSD